MNDLSYIQRMTEGADITKIENFEPLWDIMTSLRERLEERFELQEDPAVADVNRYGDPSSAYGSLHAFAGPEIDWLCHAWAGVPEKGFAAAQLAVYLGADTRVPNFIFQVATMPFVYIDLQARADLTLEMDYLDHFYSGKFNDTYLEDRKREDLEWFVSPRPALRVTDSPTSITAWVRNPETGMDTVRELAHRELDRWLAFIDAPDAPRTPVDEIEAQAERDQARRTIAVERDSMGEEVLGTELRQRVITAMTGERRSLPRVHERA